MAGPISNAMMSQRNTAVRASAPLAKQNIDNANLRAEEGENFDGTVLP
jgi:hypothetical protein